MQIITSPSKTQHFNGREYSDYSLPRLQKKTKTLIDLLKKMSREELALLLHTSEKLTDVSYRRIHSLTTKVTLQNASQALFTYQGDAYSAITADRYSDEELSHAQRHLFILSALHGILRPLDLIQPYRLEMATPLAIDSNQNLYQYWRDPVTEILKADLAKDNERTLIILASTEYAKLVDKKEFSGAIITISFKERQQGRYRTIPVYAKRARGLMVHYVISKRISDPLLLRDFREDGYGYCATESTEREWVFCRKS
ncbi:MAG: peroxide stress protein YaaA [Desulforhopalus sp.]|nr:peroxide stress protein YaaA [Desulforhopalus sp.]